MLAHYHGQTVNLSEIARSLLISDKTVRHYLDILAGTFMVRLLQPWFENIAKRQVKAPKLYFRDSGILNFLLSIQTEQDLYAQPRLGAFWEGYALEEIIRFFNASDEAFFWGTHADAELDLLLFRNGKRIGFEFKYADIPKTTKSMHSAIQDLQLDHLYIIYPSHQTTSQPFSLQKKITACTLEDIINNKVNNA